MFLRCCHERIRIMFLHLLDFWQDCKNNILDYDSLSFIHISLGITMKPSPLRCRFVFSAADKHHICHMYFVCECRYTHRMWGHIVAPVRLTDGDWTRLLGCTALLQGCDGHLITWLTEVIRHLHPTGVSARPWPPLPPCAPTSSQSRFMHMAITHRSCY